ncbi:MAG TPA: hypothetical protein VJX74_17450 [Blastocatellia bacterium]|nr:hypothetical protein [Blastocatellia bacterium]
MEAKKEGRHPPGIIYFVLDATALPSVTEKNRIAIMAKGKKFEVLVKSYITQSYNWLEARSTLI